MSNNNPNPEMLDNATGGNASHDLQPPSPGGVRRLHSEVLFGETDLIMIQHNSETYVLRKTRNGKLILTK